MNIHIKNGGFVLERNKKLSRYCGYCCNFFNCVIENLSIYHLLNTNHIRNITTNYVEIYRILSILQ